MAPILIDTNLLIYLYDTADPKKQAQAQRTLERLELSGDGWLSVQSLSEFMNVATRKLKVSAAEAVSQVNLFVRAWHVLDLTPLVIFEAARGMKDHSLSYYDAQIWAIARLNQIPVIFSEDFNDGATIEGVRFVNPFAPSFSLDAWL